MIRKIKALLLENRGTRQTILKNALWLGTGESIGRILRAIVIIYAARVLGSAGFGVFSYAIELAGLFAIFADFGIVNILTREMAKKPEKRDAYFATAFALKGVLLIVTFLLIILVAPLAAKIEGAKVLLPLVAAMIVFEGIRKFAGGAFRAFEKMEREALLVILTNAAIAVFGMVALIYTASVTGLTTAYMAGAAVGAVGAVIVLRREFLGVVKNFDTKLVRPIMTSAWPLVFMGVLGPLMFNADIIMIGWWHGPEAVGLYASSQRIVQLLQVIPGMLAVSMLPAIARFAGKGDVAQVRTLTEQSMAHMFMLIIPAVIGGMVLAEPIIRLIFGAEFVPGVRAFQILILGTLILFPGRLTTNVAFSYNKEKLIALFIAFGAFGNIALNFLLIPTFGIVGSAIATFGAFIVSRIPLWMLAKKITAFSVIPKIGKIVASALVMGACAFILNALGVHVVAIIAVSALIYAALLLILKETTALQLISAVRRARNT